MVYSFTEKKRIRKDFGKHAQVMEIPYLLSIQVDSYKQFLESDPNGEYGLEAAFRSLFPVKSEKGSAQLQYVSYQMDEPKFTVRECQIREKTYAASLHAKMRLAIYDKDDSSKPKEIKEEDVYLGDIPLMSENGTFIFNGTERVIVSQLHRSPGVFFDQDKAKTHSTGKKLYTARIIPYRGSWLDFEFDVKDLLYVRIDRRRKLFATVLLHALGYSNEEILKLFFEPQKVRFTDDPDTAQLEVSVDHLRNLKLDFDVTIDGETIVEKNHPLTPRYAKKIMKALDKAGKGDFIDIPLTAGDSEAEKDDKNPDAGNRLQNKRLYADVRDPKTGELVEGCTANTKLTRNVINTLREHGISEVNILFTNSIDCGAYLADTLEEDKALDRQSALQEIYTMMRPGERTNDDIQYYQKFFESLFMDPDRYDLSAVGRMKFNSRLDPGQDLGTSGVLTKEDLVGVLRQFIKIRNGRDTTDDIDHLGNRRIRSVGEMAENCFRTGLSRVVKAVRDRLALGDYDQLQPKDLVNPKPISAAVKEFFGSSQLSQFMDQNNPLGELTHKRRLSALGPGGLSRDRAGFEVRDIHYTHYGRMCPVETPEGPNIGLINSLACYARLNEYGFIEAPYRRIDKSDPTNPRVTDEVVYMTADEEDNYHVAQASAKIDADGYFVNRMVSGRYKTLTSQFPRTAFDFMDVSPRMVFSVATALVPFLQSDDPTRALMGSNMQRQAVPLLTTEAPIVGTGLEPKAAKDSGDSVVAKKSGTVEFVDATTIRVNNDDGTKSEYHLIKFERSNQSNCYNQKPSVNNGDHVEEGQIIADGPSTKNGELGLGKNPLIGFMTWEGYNYEDAVLISERLVKEDVYTSLHIEEYEAESRDTKLGPEEITRDVPGVGDDALKDLDDNGIIRIGAEVRAGDILVGKVTPKGETELTPEERLVRAIFGEKAREVRDTSLKVPHGEYGIVVDAKVFTRENGDELPPGVNMAVRIYIAQKRKITVGDKMAGRHGNKGVVSRVLPVEDMPFLPNGRPLDIVLNPMGVPSRMNIGQVLEIHLSLAAAALGFNVSTPVFDGASEEDIQDLLSMANDYVNNSYGEDGWKAFEDKWGEQAGPEIMKYLWDHREHRKVWKGVPIDPDGKVPVRDGRTGELFDGRVTIGHMHYLKLHHLVDDKIHARSTGPYSLVTQQPLGGKAQFGGQRFGEMEVWALEAYGAAYTLQEILTVKSDDRIGRVQTFEAIVKGENLPEPGVPESFKVLLKELQALCLNVRVLKDDGSEVEIKEDIDYNGDSEFRYEMQNNFRDYNSYSDSEAAQNGMGTKEFDENGELQDSAPEEDDSSDDAAAVLDDADGSEEQ